LRSFLATALVAVATVLGTLAVVPTASAAPPGTAIPGTTSAGTAIPGQAAVPALGAIPGKSATPAVAATPAADFTLLNDTSCFHAGDCLAVGEHYAGHATPVSDKWNGSKWGALAVHLPSGGSSGFLVSVSCKSGGCIAVGTYVHGSTGYALAEFFNGDSWSPTAAPAGVANTTQVVLESVSCVTAQDCVAAGYYDPKSNPDDEVAIAEVWNGHSWRLSNPHLAEPYNNLDTISCPTSSYCVLGGLYANSQGDYVWAEQFTNEAHWKTLSVPQPTTPNAHYQYFSGVSCLSTTSCTAVGGSENESSHNSGFIEALSGGVWRTEKVSWPSGQQSLLIADSCAAANYCIASGSIGSSALWTDGRAAFAIWNGSTWQLHVAPAPPSGQGNVLLGVQCLSSAYCTLAGTQGKTNTSTNVGLAGVVNNGTWTWKTVS
jgi:hypothetical protein